MDIKPAPATRYGKHTEEAYRKVQLLAFELDCKGTPLTEITELLNASLMVFPMELTEDDVAALIRAETVHYGMTSLPPLYDMDEFEEANEVELNIYFGESGSDRERSVEYLWSNPGEFPQFKYYPSLAS